MFEKKSGRSLLCLMVALSFLGTGAMGGDILYITADITGTSFPNDALIKDFLESLGHTVRYFSDRESEARTEVAAAAADLVWISESVGSSHVRNEITEIATPMVVGEPYAWDEMGMTLGAGGTSDVATTDITIVTPEHDLAAGLSGNVTVLTDIAGSNGRAQFANGDAGAEATVIATATLADGQTYDVLFIYEKGAALAVAPADGSDPIAADIRIGMFFHYFAHDVLNENAYALIEATVNYVLGSKPQARNPDPRDGALHPRTWAILSWLSGDFAISSDVYVGDNYGDVKNGTGDTFRGNQVGTTFAVGFPGTSYPEGLVPGTTYYWRIDGVNEVDPDSPWKGPVWSFSIPPKTAYAPDPAQGAEFVDPSAKLSWTGGFGAKLHTVYLGNDFDEVNDATEGIVVARATYDLATLESEKVYYWRVDELDGFQTYKGEVWGFTTLGAVGNPQPANAATDVQMTATLGWTPADNASSHELYFGTDEDAVRNATSASPEYTGTRALGSESYDPGKLAWNATYYWRVDAVYPADTVKGLVWSFVTADFILVDDFESYNDVDPPDAASNRIFDRWIDGFETTTNGALVGNDLPPYAEQAIVHSGGQSMPYLYDNNLKTSEATLTLVYPRDWTEEGVTKLSLWFRGDYDNASERMFVVLNGNAVVYLGDSAATKKAKWTEWVIDLKVFADQGVNLANVNTMTIGFGTKDSPRASGGDGAMLFDDIRLYR